MPLLFLLFSIFMGQPAFTLESTAFANNNFIPLNYTCSGENISPGLVIKGIPKNTQSFALIMEDPDTAFGTFDHWVMWNILPQEKIAENSAPGTVGKNGHKENKYTGPCPPSGVHQYHFKIYALDTKLNLNESDGKEALLKAMKGHIIATAELLGRFSK